jgi:hypothetical protein
MQWLEPEAAYFSRRPPTSIDMQDSSELPAAADPFFQELGAEVTFQPVMNLDDLQKGLAALH